ncbi:DUF5994 family protein [Kitasatospora aburaviensis]
MTTMLDRTTTAAPDSAARLSLAPLANGPVTGWTEPGGPAHATFFSNSSLAADLDERWGRITRITVNPAQWPVVPSRIPVTGHTVHAGWFTTEQDEHTIAVFSYAPRRLTLLVVPPNTDAVDAARLMSEAADPAGTRTASDLLAAGTGGDVAEPESRSDFLPSAVAPTDGAREAGRRAVVARSRAASWPVPG